MLLPPLQIVEPINRDLKNGDVVYRITNNRLVSARVVTGDRYTSTAIDDHDNTWMLHRTSAGWKYAGKDGKSPYGIALDVVRAVQFPELDEAAFLEHYNASKGMGQRALVCKVEEIEKLIGKAIRAAKEDD